MKYGKLLLIFLLPFVFSFDVKAATCDTVELNELKELAKKVEFTYDFTKKIETNAEEGSYLVVDFKITAFNLDERLSVLVIDNYYTDDYQEFKYNTSKISSLSGFASGQKVKVTIKAYTKNECSGENLLTKTVSLPYYNNFYDSEDCDLYPDFKYCTTEILTNSVTNKMFQTALNDYLDNSDDKQDDNVNNNENSNNFNLNEMLGLGIMVVVILLLIILITIKIIKGRKRNGL